MRKLIADLQPNTEYSFVLMNRGSSAGGLQHLVSIRTAPDLLQHKPLLASAYIEDGRFTLSMPHVQDPSLVRCADNVLGKRAGLVTHAQAMTVLIPALSAPPHPLPRRWFYVVVVPIDRVGGSLLTPRWNTPEELELDEVQGRTQVALSQPCGSGWLWPQWLSQTGISGWQLAPLQGRGTRAVAPRSFRELLQAQRIPWRGLLRIPGV